jgi:hypothetical protein
MRLISSLILVFATCLAVQPVLAQNTIPYDWQQFASYDMDIDMDVESNQFKGTQRLVYENHSPDTLDKLYYHLYFNAFQPNSMMDVRSRSISDPDGRVRDRIFHLTPDEIGYQKILSLKQNGNVVKFSVSETVLIVELNDPIPPGGQATMDMTFEGQVPLQIRRSGRDSREGIRYSMVQWYPRIAGYDREGWATSPYIGREFHGTFSDFDVRITIDSTYTLGGTGYLQNPQEIGKGYETPGMAVQRPSGDKLTWHFKAPNVIDFAWTADNKYTHETYQIPGGGQVHLLYVKGPQTRAWSQLGDYTVRAIQFLSEYLGPYPYEQFSVLQGGDGGMEYPMSTLVTGHRNLNSLVGVMVHELMHMWFQTSLATNEAHYAWMDEGFTTYMSSITMDHLFGRENASTTPIGSYLGYMSLMNDELAEPATTHSDHFNTNRAYSTASYTLGAVILGQLGYIMGEDALKNTLQRYYAEWKFRHPGPDEFRRVAEKESGLQLRWFFDQSLNTNDPIDYAIKRAGTNAGTLEIELERQSRATMPLDILVRYTDGTSELLYIPEQLMLGSKPIEADIYGATPRTDLMPWRWTDPTYSIALSRPGKELDEVVIDPTLRLMDSNRMNNTHPFPLSFTYAQPLRTSGTDYNVTWRPALWYGEVSGLHLGFASQGAYLFGNNALEVSAMLTTGDLDNFETKNLDVDYDISYTKRLKHLGKATTATLAARRFYGIGEESLTLNKYIGDLGRRESTIRLLSVRLFHQYSTATRNLNFLQSQFDDESVLGMHLSYTVGDMAGSGIQTNLVTGAQDRRWASGYFSVTANHRFEWTDAFSTKVGMSGGTGSETMPTQWLWAVSGPTGEQAWRNDAYWSMANISADLTSEYNLVANDGTGLLGYAIPGIGSPDVAGNNYVTGTIWNNWQPFADHRTLRLLEVELFAAMGKSWMGEFTGYFPDSGFLASMGTGITFDVSALPVLRRWTPQSKVLQDLQLSVRMPFFLNGITGEDEWGSRFVIGISESF